jgi:hypothetical protein
VLYDDGSFESAQRIARFVRAFEPESVVRMEKNADTPPWPADAMPRRDAIEQAAASAWRDGEAPVTREGLRDQWKKLRFEPCGVVIAEPDDPTWTGALALAAGHGEPILWASYPKAARGDVSGTMSANDAADLNGAIESSLRQLGYEFQALGDQIDAVTLCYNGPVKIFPGGDDRSLAISLTDFIGRSWNEQRHLDTKRWAWCGQLVGNEAQSAYMAMCSLFLSTKSAWLFDGYEAGEPWSQFDMTLAASVLEKSGIRTTVDDIGRQSLPDWRRRAAGLQPPAPAPPTAAPEPGKAPPPPRRVGEHRVLRPQARAGQARRYPVPSQARRGVLRPLVVGGQSRIDGHGRGTLAGARRVRLPRLGARALSAGLCADARGDAASGLGRALGRGGAVRGIVGVEDRHHRRSADADPRRAQAPGQAGAGAGCGLAQR